ncbi:uncharacterized protein F4817DRAFT_342123 [Daldinia loculata]|uniref:uncharacterized protein n=1 Tax=Daldinia loculata TaxID=103429 RepID=UPI0020C52BD5|nr:uncharacterized protein F4817DRAFT_342123 [Daldinia loculata]KAI1645985.1 hypothetical protein F4817DRAFT_342123 [Daldinia loculata]
MRTDDKYKERCRVIMCGVIEGYNTPFEERYGVKNSIEIFSKRLTLTGFVVTDEDFGPAYFKQHQETLQK